MRERESCVVTLWRMKEKRTHTHTQSLAAFQMIDLVDLFYSQVVFQFTSKAPPYLSPSHPSLERRTTTYCVDQQES